MTTPSPPMSNPRHPTLAAFLTGPARSEGTLTYHETQGLLFAIACAPDLVPPSEWMPRVFGGDRAEYASMDEADAVLGDLMALYNAVNQEVLEHRCALPEDVEVREPALANLDDDAPLSQWARGFLDGHQWLAESWDFVPEALEDEFGASFMVLGLFASRAETEEFFSSGEHGDLATVAAGALRILPDAMNGYARLGRALGRALEEFGEPAPVRSTKVGRNEPCPCGSGKKFKKCCGA